MRVLLIFLATEMNYHIFYFCCSFLYFISILACDLLPMSSRLAVMLSSRLCIFMRSLPRSIQSVLPIQMCTHIQFLPAFFSVRHFILLLTSAVCTLVYMLWLLRFGTGLESVLSMHHFSIHWHAVCFDV